MICGILILLINPPRKGDEGFHTLQVKRIYRADTNFFVPELTTIPGYHFTLAFISKVINPVLHFKRHPKTRVLRFIQACLALLLPLTTFLITKELKKSRKLVLAIVLMPIIFPMLFLVYTDVFSLILFLAAFLFHIKKRYDLAALFVLLDILVRQDNVIWLVFLMTLLAYEVYQKHKSKGIDKKFIQDLFSSSGSYFMVLFLFIGFYIFNNGVAIGDKSAHPPMKFHAGNLWLFFAVFFIIFLPLIMAKLVKIIKLFRSKLTAVVPLILFGYFLFRKTFVFTHPYNNQLNTAYLYNAILNFIANNQFMYLVVYISIILSVGYIFVQGFIQKKYNISIIFIVLSLLLHWLISGRYYFIPLVLLFLTLDEGSRILKHQIIYSATMSIIIFYFFFFTDNVLP